MPQSLSDVKAFEAATKGPSSLVHFSADWAEQCKQVDDVLDALSTRPEYSAVKFFRCAAEDLSEVSLQHKIEAVPTVLFFRGGKAVDRVDGADVAKITDKLKSFASAVENGAAGNATTNSTADEEEAAFTERLRSLVNQAPVMLFMKGTRTTPRCGFSRTITQMLNDTGVEYETFDILEDEEVRQGLKAFSDWPTYPQLYVKGELIGGLDIVKELQGAGDLVATLKG